MRKLCFTHIVVFLILISCSFSLEEYFPTYIASQGESLFQVQMEDRTSDSPGRDYFAGLEFDSQGNVVETAGATTLEELMQDQNLFVTTWEREREETGFQEIWESAQSSRYTQALERMKRFQQRLLTPQSRLRLALLQLDWHQGDQLTPNLQANLRVLMREHLFLLESAKDGSSSDSVREELDLAIKEFQKLLGEDQYFGSDEATVDESTELVGSDEAEPEESSDEASSAERRERTPRVEELRPRREVARSTPETEESPQPEEEASRNRANIDNPVMSLSIRRASQINDDTAQTILRGMGLMNSRRDYQTALKGLYRGYTYTRHSGHLALNSQMKEYLFREYTLLRQALEKWGHLETISQSKTPQLFEKWVQEASHELKALDSPSQRYALIKSLMTQETGRTHWRSHVPVMGAATDIGFGQFLPATAQSVDINPYDPQENIKGIARYLNKLISSHGVREGLARYNGGNNPPEVSYRYASRIMSRMVA